MRDERAFLNGDAGFTLVEVLVALAIFSLAAMALLRLQGAALATTGRLDEKAIAQIVAQNRAVELIIAPTPATFGATAGTEINAGRQWNWTQAVLRTPDPRLQRIEIKVAGQDGTTAAAATIVRPAA